MCMDLILHNFINKSLSTGLLQVLLLSIYLLYYPLCQASQVWNKFGFRSSLDTLASSFFWIREKEPFSGSSDRYQSFFISPASGYLWKSENLRFFTCAWRSLVGKNHTNMVRVCMRVIWSFIYDQRSLLLRKNGRHTSSNSATVFCFHNIHLAEQYH